MGHVLRLVLVVCVHATLLLMLVLVIEDDPEIARSVRSGLERAGHEAHHAADGDSGLRMATSTPYDAAIVDLMLPGVDGLTLIETMRAKQVMTPIIVLSAKRSTDDKVVCLRRGADDYLAKPFDMPELLARLEAVLRRSQPAGESECLEAADVVLDLVNRTARRGSNKIELTPREFALLELLIRNQGRPLSKFYLIERLWNYKFTPQTNLVDVLVCRLRNNIDRDFPIKLIHTVRGIGYVFRAT
jgi:two-component system, OmpR family, response regulator